MSYCRRGPASPSESDASAAPLTIRQSCCKDLAWKSLHASSLHNCSEDFHMSALKTKYLPFKLRKLG
jgi:hypothetical protein